MKERKMRTRKIPWNGFIKNAKMWTSDQHENWKSSWKK